VLFDLHVLSEHSPAGRSPIEELLRAALVRGLGGLAVCDRDSFEGSREACERAAQFELLVIPAMAVQTEHGEIIGLFLEAPLVGRGFDELEQEIHGQNGLVVLSHPFCNGGPAPSEVLARIDLIEAYNAQSASRRRRDENGRAQALARERGLPVTAGSEARFPFEIGRGAVELGAVKNLDQARDALLESGEGAIVVQNHSPLLDLAGRLTETLFRLNNR